MVAMLLRASWILALAACATAPSRRESAPALPEAWLVVAVYDDGLQIMRRSFAAREEAEAFVSRTAPEPGDSAPTLAVQKDSPSLRVQIQPVPIRQPHDLTVRNHWLRRNAAWTDSLRPLGLTASVYTWAPGHSTDPCRSRLGGTAPAVPCCAPEKRTGEFLGTLDFRRTSVRASVPADSLWLYRCTECRSPIVRWIDARHDQVPEGGLLGTRWDVADFPWDEKTEAAYEDRMDRMLAGQSPQLLLTVQGTKVGGYAGVEAPACSCGKSMRFIGRLDTATLFHCCDSKVIWP